MVEKCLLAGMTEFGKIPALIRSKPDRKGGVGGRSIPVVLCVRLRNTS